MKTLKAIYEQMGYVTAKQAKEVAEVFPNMPVVIRYGYLPRKRTTMALLDQTIAQDIRESKRAGQEDYVRDCFIEAGFCDKMASLFGLPK